MVQYFCIKSQINPLDIKTSYFKNGKRDEYSATHKSDLNFYFRVFINNDSNEADVRIDLGVGEGGGFPKVFHETIKNTAQITSDLEHTIDHAIYNYNLKYKPFNLETLKNNTLRVYGYQRGQYSELDELCIFLYGVQYVSDTLTIYKIQHIEQGYRSFSYAFYVDQGVDPFWVFFLHIGALDSGGAKIALDQVETTIGEIRSKVKITKKEYSIDYNELEKFLKANAYSFQSPVFNEIRFELLNDLHVFDSTFQSEYEKMLAGYYNKDYSNVLKQLRMLIEKALRSYCDKEQVEYNDKDRIDVLCAKIQDNEKKEILLGWCHAFRVVANLHVHGHDGKWLEKQDNEMMCLLGMRIISHISEELE